MTTHATHTPRTAATPPESDRVLFEDVQAVLDDRALASPPDGRHVPQWVRATVKRELGSVDVDVDVRTGSRECDVVVGGTVGIEIVDGLASYGRRGLKRHLETVGRDCEYLVVFVHELPGDARDAWWLTRRRLTPRALGVVDIAFIKPETDTDTRSGRSPLMAWLLLAPAILFLAAYLGVGLVEAAEITSHPMLVLVVPAIGVTALLALILKTAGDA